MDKQTLLLAEKIWDYMLMHQPLEKADAIIVLGSLNTTPANRGAELFLEGWATLLVMVGGQGRITKDHFDKSEAQIYADIAIEIGVPRDKILLEEQSTNTGDNIRFTRELLEQQGIKPQKLILVHKPYMERRTYATFKKQWPEVDFIVTSPQISFEEWSSQQTKGGRFISFLVGDLQRILIYPAKGFQIKQEVPHDVLDAYNELIRLGYTEQLAREQ